MGRVRKIARRTFLIGGGIAATAVAGGVAYGTVAYRRPYPNPLLDGLPEGAAAITPFVRIDAEGVTLITPRADMGQGAWSMQASLIAEEMDIDPLTVRTDPGPPAKAYYNSALLEEAVPFAPYDRGDWAEWAREATDVPAKLLAIQMTGGSSTVPDMVDRLRHAGAVARETLKEAAARRTGHARDTLATDNGAVILPDGTRLPYTDLAADAGQIAPVAVETLRDPATWRYLGRPRQRLDIVRKSTGTEVYGIDMRLPDMLFATVRLNPRIGGAVERIDSAAAEAMPGVVRVLPVTQGVAVVARNTWHAFRAAAAVDVTFGPAPYPETSAEMWQVLTDTIEAEAYNTRKRDDGDVEAAMAAGEVIAAEYRVPYLAHAGLEPVNLTMQVQDDRADVWIGTQVPGFVRDLVADLTGLPPDAVHVHVLPIGGSFGRRLETGDAVQATEIAMAMAPRPVKLTWSREEDFAHDFPRPMALARARGKVSDGRVEAYDLTLASASVVRSQMGRLLAAPALGPDPMLVAGGWDQPFAFPNYRVTGKIAPEMVPISSWRSVGASSNGFLHGGFLDELFHAAGIDPLQGLLDHCVDPVSVAVIEAVGEMSGWDGPRIAAGRGRGVAFCLSFGVPCAQVIEVTDTDRGVRIDRLWAAADVGRVLDPVNAEAQLSGAALFSLGHAMNAELTYADQRPEQRNFDAYEGLRMPQTPQVEVRLLENGPRIRGLGEPGVPPAPPALANAIFAATGQRIRELPLNRHVRFA